MRTSAQNADLTGRIAFPKGPIPTDHWFGAVNFQLCASVSCPLCSAQALCADVYFNDFNLAPGTTYPEWTSTSYTNSANRAGTVAAVCVARNGSSFVATLN